MGSIPGPGNSKHVGKATKKKKKKKSKAISNDSIIKLLSYSYTFFIPVFYLCK